VAKAEAVIARDDVIDEAYHQIFRRILETMLGDPGSVERGIHIQSVAKFLERIGDHCTNLAEQVIFMVKGKDIRHVGKLA
jgi:phosphate transport system protein